MATIGMDGKRERGQNWTQEEKLFLFNQIQERIDAIECNHNDHNSLRAKLDAWKEIYDEFCQRYGQNRELQRVREMWRRMKAYARTEYKEWEKAKQRGDGSESQEIPSEISQLVHDLLPQEFIVQQPRVLYSEQYEQYPSMIGVQPRVSGIDGSGGSFDLGGGDTQGSCSNPATPSGVVIIKSEEDTYLGQGELDSFQQELDQEENSMDHHSNGDSQTQPERSSPQLQTTNWPITSNIIGNHSNASLGPSSANIPGNNTSDRGPSTASNIRNHGNNSSNRGSSSAVFGTGVFNRRQDVEQEITKLRLREQKRKLEMMEEQHKAKMRIIRVEKQMEQLSNSNRPRPSSSTTNSTTTTAERYRNMWQHHDSRIDVDKEVLKMKQEEHRRRMEVLEEQHSAKMTVFEMERDLVKMKIEAFMKEMRKDVDANKEEDAASNHSNHNVGTQRDNEKVDAQTS